MRKYWIVRDTTCGKNMHSLTNKHWSHYVGHLGVLLACFTRYTFNQPHYNLRLATRFCSVYCTSVFVAVVLVTMTRKVSSSYCCGFKVLTCYLQWHRRRLVDHCYSSANGTQLSDVSPQLLNHNWGLWQVRLMHVECERNCVHYSYFER
jgi:hypothetical protein